MKSGLRLVPDETDDVVLIDEDDIKRGFVDKEWLGKRVIASIFPASKKSIKEVLELEVGNKDDGRSNFMWVRLVNGDLMLALFPWGDGYFAVEENVYRDFTKAEQRAEAIKKGS